MSDSNLTSVPPASHGVKGGVMWDCRFRNATDQLHVHARPKSAVGGVYRALRPISLSLSTDGV